ncbi:hypothetical protein RJ639_004899 [Escallonia herrerae]|uniref:histidinol-phosphate transaminase n=1 Tax=Escallonia herrerae TaxID=1293975 RepID=A0AA88W4W7_9ASTE|nr:hypothetical protein RJ639_004899 [Escallonia herrerae]
MGGKHENLIVLRTFSKFAGLAGLRVGYGAFPLSIIGNSSCRICGIAKPRLPREGESRVGARTGEALYTSQRSSVS